MRYRNNGPVFAMFAATLLVGACGKPDTEAGDMGKAAAGPEPEAPIAAALPRTAAPAGAHVFFISPANGDTVSNPVSVEFGIEGMSVVKAGDNAPQSGHHHLLVDADLPDVTLPIPANANYIHFGDGSTATELTLEPGEHTLRLLLGDHLHIPHDPPVTSEPITIIVQ